MSERWLNWHEVNEASTEKEIIFFGRGNWVLKTYPYLTGKISCIVDNNPYEWGQVREHDLIVYDPMLLNEIDWSKHFIIITTSGFDEVQKQLQSFGMVSGKHFCISPALEDHKAQVEIDQHEVTLYLTCSDHYIKDKRKYGGGLYRYHIPSCTLTKIFSGKCHGITCGKEGYYLVDDQTQGIWALDERFSIRDHFELPHGCRPHGITYCSKRNLIFVVFTDLDSIGVYDAKDYKLIQEISLSQKRQELKAPQHHINDLVVFKNSLYVSMFSFSGNWKAGIFDGGILEFDIETYLTSIPVVTGLWMPHTPTIIKGELYYVDSMRGRLFRGTEELLAEFNGFIRGVAYDNHFYYVGQSMHRHPGRLRNISHNISLDTGIFMIDEDSHMTKFFSIPQLTDIDTILIP